VTASAPRKPIIRGARGCLVGLVTVVGSFVIASLAVDRLATEPVTGALPSSFPMVAMAPPAPGAAAVPFLVTGGTLERFRKEHPEHSFLLPVGGGAEVGRHLRSMEQPYAEGLYVAAMSMTEKSGRQRIELNAPWHSDIDNVAAYETSGRDIVPIHTRTGHHLTFAARTTALGVTLAFTILLVAAIAERIWLRGKGAALSSPS
jgi:hypothetical protein